MRGEQKTIVLWIQAQLARLKISPEQWARRSGLHPTTLTRAMKPDYQSVTSIPTLHALAIAAGVPSVLDFLSDWSNASVNLRPSDIQIMVDAVLDKGGTREQIADAIAHGLSALCRVPPHLWGEASIRTATESALLRLDP